MMQVIARIAQQFKPNKTINNNNSNTMKEGTVKFFNSAKGFGFISPTDSREDIFVHESGLIDEVQENDRVNFDVEPGKKGMNAVNVKVIS